jgi:creatinine amidohydrolase
MTVHYDGEDHVASDRRHLLTLGMSGYTESGLIGRPSLTTAEKGELVLAALARSFEVGLPRFDGQG